MRRSEGADRRRARRRRALARLAVAAACLAGTALSAAAGAASAKPAWAAAIASAPGFVDPLDAPAQSSALAPRRLLNDVVSAGGRLVAVGQRGHVILSDDGGTTWAQASVPVGVDLTAVHFASPARGWAVGHGGVILATADGGRRWVKQLDRRDLVPLLAAGRAAGLPESPPGGEGEIPRSSIAEQLGGPTSDGADLSFLDVWFADERSGFAVGAFNLIVHTDDGGRTWSPWLDRAENPKGLHLYAIRAVAGSVYIAGERGLILKLDPAGRRFEALSPGFTGSFFGVTGTATAVIAHGLRGTAVRSRDGGASWHAIDTGVEDALTGSVEAGGRIVVVSHGGDVLVSDDEGESFRAARLGRRAAASAVALVAGDGLVLVGPAGVRRETLRE